MCICLDKIMFTGNNISSVFYINEVWYQYILWSICHVIIEWQQVISETWLYVYILLKADVMCWHILAVNVIHYSRVIITYVTLNLIVIDLGKMLLLNCLSRACVSDIWHIYFFLQKSPWKYHLQTIGHFRQASMRSLMRRVHIPSSSCALC